MLKLRDISIKDLKVQASKKKYPNGDYYSICADINVGNDRTLSTSVAFYVHYNENPNYPGKQGLVYRGGLLKDCEEVKQLIHDFRAEQFQEEFEMETFKKDDPEYDMLPSEEVKKLKTNNAQAVVKKQLLSKRTFTANQSDPINHRRPSFSQ